MTAEADSEKSLIKVENTDPIGAGFTNTNKGMLEKQHYKASNFVHRDSPTK